MRPRSEAILESLVQEFIQTGEPVSSERLFEKYDFGIRPASIRSEMNELTQLGFLEQPHHSAGRIPSNKGYEFYVNFIWKEAEPEIPKEVANFFRSGELPEFLEEFSRELNVLGVASEDGPRRIYKQGLGNLFDCLPAHSETEVKQIIRDFENLDERLLQIENTFEENFLNVFVGNKSPITRSDDLSVIIGDYFPQGQRIFLMAIGPKRMDYEKPLKIFRGLKEINK